MKPSAIGPIHKMLPYLKPRKYYRRGDIAIIRVEDKGGFFCLFFFFCCEIVFSSNHRSYTHKVSTLLPKCQLIKEDPKRSTRVLSCTKNRQLSKPGREVVWPQGGMTPDTNAHTGSTESTQWIKKKKKEHIKLRCYSSGEDGGGFRLENGSWLWKKHIACTYKDLQQTHHSRSYSSFEDHKLQRLPLCQVKSWKFGWV